MEDILKTTVRLTKLVNALPVNSGFDQDKTQKSILQGYSEPVEDKSCHKVVKKSGMKVFDELVKLNKYVNPSGKKEYEFQKSNFRGQVLL